MHPYPTGGEWRLKYERAVREVDFTKKRLQQEFEDKLEVEQQSKRQLERRVSLAKGAWRIGRVWSLARGNTPRVGGVVPFPYFLLIFTPPRGSSGY